MASQSLQNEERNRLRLQAWEQRNQESSQSKEPSPDTSPLFGKPYKVFQTDELSSRIRRMFGSFEDVNGLVSMEALQTAPQGVAVSQSDHSPPDSQNWAQLPFRSQALHASADSPVGPPTQPGKTPSSSSSPRPARQSSTPPFTLSLSGNFSQSDHQLRKSGVLSDLMQMSSPSPPPSPSHSSDHRTPNRHSPDGLDDQRLQRRTDQSTTDVSPLNMKQSPYDAAPPENKTGSLPSQTFPPLLPSKQPCTLATQKPTAYVRPMDGQDQVARESPELKPSPEPYAPDAEALNKSDLNSDGKPRPLETPAGEAQCVEDILREMTRSWPPLLATLHTPPEASKIPVKDAALGSSCPQQQNCDSSSWISSQLKQQPSSHSLCVAAHSGGRDSLSSSNSDSSSGSDCESGNATEEPPSGTQPRNSTPPRVDWQLGNWIRSGQQSSAPKRPQRREEPSDQIGPSGPPGAENCGDRPGRQNPVSAQRDGRSRKASRANEVTVPDCAVAKDPLNRDSCFSDKPKVKTKDQSKERDARTDPRRAKTASLPVLPTCPSCGMSDSTRCLCPPHSPAQPPPDRPTPGKHKAKAIHPPKGTARNPLKDHPPSLLVRIDLKLLPIASPPPGPDGPETDHAHRPRPLKSSRKHKKPHAAVEDSVVSRKKQKLENKSSSSMVPVKPEVSNSPSETPRKKSSKRASGRLKVDAPESKSLTMTSKERKSSQKRSGTKAAKRCSEPVGRPLTSVTSRPLLRPDDRRRPVKHYIKEAKRLKHQADAESDKLSKAFSYLEAAMFFVESGVAMETDPHVSMSSYTMFAETVELLKFVLRLKSPDSSSSPAEKDFLTLCLKCQSLLQMTMFRLKHKTALRYSRTLTEHFTASAQATPTNPVRPSEQPAPLPLPPAVEQMAFSYVGITSLLLSAHDGWEQAEQLAQGGSGLLSELDAVFGPLSLSSAMSSLVRYARQAVHWLRLNRPAE